MSWFKLTFLLLLPFCAGAQVKDSLGFVAEQQLEIITENNGDAETEDDTFVQQFLSYRKHPLDLNTAHRSELEELRVLSSAQISNFISHRAILGPLIDIYELQAVPGWDIQTIRMVSSYITVSIERKLKEKLLERLKGGDHTVLTKGSQVLERSRGFLQRSSQVNNYYLGSPQRVMVRYKYAYRNLLQYGFVGEKDPGEQFFKGAQDKGFDFYSAHIFIKNIGFIKALALGDFTVNLGQGLIHWQSLAFKKGPDVISIKRQAATLRPYNSAGEYNFHRGAGITLTKGNWEATFFGSLKNSDANFVSDTLGNDEFVSSLQISGYHRTSSEIADKGIQRQIVFGSNVVYTAPRFQAGLNAVRHSFKYPLRKDDQPYNQFALSGNQFGNYSIDYSYIYRNVHLFGEAAISDIKHVAFVNGLLISAAPSVDLSFFYRNISTGYQAMHGNAFTESTYPVNEKGVFTGIRIKPTAYWQFDAYADMYRFPGLRYRVNGPSTGSEYMVQVLYRPNKQLEAFTRYKKESKGINYDPGELVIRPVIPQTRQNWRAQVNFKISPSVMLRNRMDIIWFDKKGPGSEEGYLMYADLLYKPQMKPLSGNIRLMYFETEGYNSRLYAFENDVLYNFAIPVFYDKGYRYYINLNYDINRRLAIWAKVSQTLYREKAVIGSGLDEIAGNRKTEIKFLLMYKF